MNLEKFNDFYTFKSELQEEIKKDIIKDFFEGLTDKEKLCLFLDGTLYKDVIDDRVTTEGLLIQTIKQYDTNLSMNTGHRVDIFEIFYPYGEGYDAHVQDLAQQIIDEIEERELLKIKIIIEE